MKITDQELRDTMVEPFAVGDDKDVADAMQAIAAELLAARKVVKEARHVVAMGQVLHRSDVEARNRDILVAALAEYDKAVGG